MPLSSGPRWLNRSVIDFRRGPSIGFRIDLYATMPHMEISSIPEVLQAQPREPEVLFLQPREHFFGGLQLSPL